MGGGHENKLEPGIYYVTLGVINPATGEECTMEREVHVVEGYYIYAPVLKVKAGTTDYNLLEGVEVRNADTEEPVTEAQVDVEDISDLLKRGSSEEEEPALFSFMKASIYTQVQTPSEAVKPEKDQTLPALNPGTYSVTLSTVDPESGNKIYVVRSVAVTNAAYEVNYIVNSKKYGQRNLIDLFGTAEDYATKEPKYELGSIWGDIYGTGEDVYQSYYVTDITKTPYLETMAGAWAKRMFAGSTKTGDGREKYTDYTNGQEFWKIKDLEEGGDEQNTYGAVYLEKHLNDASWDNLRTEGSGLYDWDTHEWKNDPDVTVNVKQYSDTHNEAYSLPFKEWMEKMSKWGGQSRDNSIVFDGVEPGTIYGKGYPGRKPVDENVPYLEVNTNGSNDQVTVPTGQWAIRNMIAYKLDLGTAGRPNFLLGKDTVLRFEDCTGWPTLNDDGRAGLSIRIGGRESDSWNAGGKEDAPENSVVQIDMPDRKDIPGFRIGYVDRVQIKAGNVEPMGNIAIYDCNNIEIDLPEENSILKTDYLIGGTVNTNRKSKATLTLKGKGKLYPSSNSYHTINVRNIELEGNVTLGHNNGTNEPIWDIGRANNYWESMTLESNGHKLAVENIYKKTWTGDYQNLQNEEQTAPMRAGQLITRTQKGILNDYTELPCLTATDFKLIHGEEDKNLYITGEYYIEAPSIYSGRTGEYGQLVVRQFAHFPIEVTPGFDGEAVSYFKNYAEAFKKIAEAGSGETDYTIKNLVERDFDTVADDGTVTNDASEALLQITPEHARSLTFESGKRPATSGYFRQSYGNYGIYYEIRLRNSVLKLPKDVDVTFKNISLMYDQGTGQEAKTTVDIVGNGGRLKFGADVKMIDVHNQQMLPNVYGGTQDSKDPTTKPSVIELSDAVKLGSVYNFDLLEISNGGMSMGWHIAYIEGDLDAQKDGKTKEQGGYEGAVRIITEDSDYHPGEWYIGGLLVLDSSNGIKKIGSLQGCTYEGVTLGESSGEQSKITIRRPDDAANKDNPAVLQLTSQDPLASEETDPKTKILIKYTDDDTPEYGDVIMHFQNVPDGQEFQQVVMTRLLDGFRNENEENPIYMKAFPSDRVIALSYQITVGVSIGDSTDIVTYDHLKEALDAIAANEKKTPGSDYKIIFFTGTYRLRTEDFEALNKMASTTAGQITWTSSLDKYGNQLETNNIVNVPGNISFFGKKTILDGITLKYATDQDLYANGAPLEIRSNTYITGNGKVSLYGGSSTKAVDTTSLKIDGGTFGCIYGGGKGYGAASTDISMTADTAGTSVYGGSRNAETKKTNVSVLLPNTAEKAAFEMADVSGFGTDDKGAVAENVTGEASVVLKQSAPDLKCAVTVGNLTGFKNLTLGDEAGAFDKQIFELTGTFDSKAEAADKGRTDTVNLNAVTLSIAGGSGHIGNLVSSGGSVLVSARADESTKPLLVDGNVIKKDENRIKLRVKEGSTLPGDIMVTYTNGKNADTSLYVDGGDYGLIVEKQENKTDRSKTDIVLSEPQAHAVQTDVEYPETGNVDETGKSVSKILTFDYDASNTDPVLRGYVIPMPESKVDADDSKKYTDMNASFIKNGTYDGGGAYPIYEIDWTKSEENGNNSATGRTKTAVPITENTWYIAHIVCEGGHKYSFLVDVTAPRQAAGKDVSIYYNGEEDSYVVKAVFFDPTVEHMTEHPLPDSQYGKKLTYNAHGLRQYGWALGDASGNTLADQEAKKSKMSVNEDETTGKKGIREVEDAKIVYSEEGTYTFKINKADMEAAKQENQNVLWIYAKDGMNNTIRLAVPMGDQMIDVTVPTRLKLAALKKSPSSKDADVPKLLAPTCYIVNNGTNKVRVEISGFERKNITGETPDASGLRLVTKGKDDGNFQEDEISLFIKKNTVMMNVMKLREQKDPVTGYGPMPLGEVVNGTPLDFTFDAGYNPTKIVETTNWITNEMSYRFYVVKDTQP